MIFPLHFDLHFRKLHVFPIALKYDKKKTPKTKKKGKSQSLKIKLQFLRIYKNNDHARHISHIIYDTLYQTPALPHLHCNLFIFRISYHMLVRYFSLTIPARISARHVAQLYLYIHISARSIRMSVRSADSSSVP